MCGRFTLAADVKDIIEHFAVEDVPSVVPRYNVAPGQEISAVVAAEGDVPAGREMRRFTWGLVPSWTKDLATARKPINARAETAAQKPSFREALKRRRCLIAADGFFEWAGRVAGRKQPYYFRLRNESVFGFAGLWERWRSPEDGQVLETCAILTTEANELLASVHDRMPVIIHPEDYELWLGDDDGDERLRQSRRELLRPYPAEGMTAHPVGTRINDPGRESPDLIARLGEINSA